MVDDEDWKVRRNLVMACSVVCLLSWLEIPEGAISERLFGYIGFRISEHKTLWAGAVLLFYLILRFRFSDEAIKSHDSLKQEQKLRAERVIKIYVRLQLSMFTQFGYQSRIFIPRIGGYTAERRARVLEAPPDASMLRPIVHDAAISVDSSLATGSLHPVMSFEHKGERYLSKPGKVLNFIVTGGFRYLVWVISWTLTAIYSVQALALIYPIILWTIAMIVIANRLSNFYQWWI